MRIRTATRLDREDIRNVCLLAFSKEERKIVADLAINLLSEVTLPPTLSFVAESEGTVVGHVAFSPVTLEGDPDFQGYLLAPLAVMPRYQRSQFGSKLVETGLQHVSRMKVRVLFVYGDPNYYTRFGFSADAAVSYPPPYKLRYPHGWLAIALNNHDMSAQYGPLCCVSSLRDPELW